jgi:hypothetical protein
MKTLVLTGVTSNIVLYLGFPGQDNLASQTVALRTLCFVIQMRSLALVSIIATIATVRVMGRTFSQSWQMITAAVFSLYIADMWFK